MPPCPKQGPYRDGLSRPAWKNLTGLHRALTSTSSNIFGMNWNADSEPGLIAKHHCPTSVMLLWLNGSKSPQLASPTSSGKPSQKSGGCSSSIRGDQLHIYAHDFGMRWSTIRCPHTVEVGSLHALMLEWLKLVFQPLHTFLVNKLQFWQVG